MSRDDMALVGAFAATRSEAAFAALVQRHIGLVYSAALRQTSDAHLAEEITQVVFIILARKAGALGLNTILPAWLYHTTRYSSANALKIQRRRRAREREAYMRFTLDRGGDAASPPASEPIWPQLAPLLDDAMAKLPERDRAPLVLRYFENRPWREIAGLMHVTEDAAQKRATRALDKLRLRFARRGVRSTAAAIGEIISANSIQPLPPALAQGITATALAQGAAASTSTLPLVKGALNIMAWTNAKTAIATGAALILAAGITTPLVVHHFRPSALTIAATKQLSDDDDAGYQRLTGLTPEQAARAILEAWGSEDWQKLASFFPPGEAVYKEYGGLQVLSLGKPFKGTFRGGGQYGGVYVPYTIRLKSGSIKQWHLAIRCDNPEHRWYFDGGM